VALYEIVLIFVAAAIFSAIFLPRLFADKPLSFPIVYVGIGFVLFSLPLGVPDPDPLQYPRYAERLTELVVIIALMGGGLKIDRPFSLKTWIPAWRLLAITMPLTIASTALLGWGLAGLLLPTAVLLGAVIAPTDPVLASDVGASDPTEEIEAEAAPGDQEDEIRFALTSEAGLNDGLAVPFTYLAIALASITVRSADFEGDISQLILTTLLEWFAFDFVYRIVAGIVVGYLIGRVVAYLVFGAPSTTELAEAMEGAEALATTFLAYAVAELVYGYGFIAVFVAALELRHYEWTHDYYTELDNFAVMVERLLMAAVLVLFGGAISTGLLDLLTIPLVAIGLAVVFVIRPAAGLVGLIGSDSTWRERSVIASFGIRGIGSFYYLAFALNAASFQEFELVVAASELWATLGFVVVASLTIHGISASPVMNTIDKWRKEHKEGFVEPEEID
jgi:NhaP-type Na+/H+ or K+/H+ antiporter